MPHAAETFRYYAGWCTKLDGHTFQPSVPGVEFHGYVRHEPVGVVAQIIPWNGALVAAAWKLAPALAAGCSVVLKPAEHSTLSVLWLGALLLEAGVPDGVVNIVPGSGRVLGAALAAHPDVDKIAFTGSTAVGKQLLSAAQGNLKRLTLELGGKSPTLIFADADLDEAIAGAAQAIFANAGQVCVAGSRVYAERAIYAQVPPASRGSPRRSSSAPGLAPDTQMGPLISSAHRRTVHEIVSRSRGDDVRVLTGGEIAAGDGFFYPATVVACEHGERAGRERGDLRSGRHGHAVRRSAGRRASRERLDLRARRQHLDARSFARPSHRRRDQSRASCGSTVTAFRSSACRSAA